LNLPPDILHLRLKIQLENRLPGTLSHTKMLPPGRSLELPVNKANFTGSAVLMLLFPLHQKTHICLIRRPATMKNHAGQIAFPGGKQEKEDSDLVQTALREANEEIGLAIGDVQILGTLTPVYVQVSNFLITPVVGWVNELPALKIDPSEVDEVIFISLDELSEAGNRCDKEMDTWTGKILVPGYEINGCFVWGATAMLMAELVDVYQDAHQL